MHLQLGLAGDRTPHLLSCLTALPNRGARSEPFTDQKPFHRTALLPATWLSLPAAAPPTRCGLPCPRRPSTAQFTLNAAAPHTPYEGVNPPSCACSRPATSGNPPPPRCGHSSCVYGGRLWVVGGGSGHDLLRSGHDLGDVYCLDLTTLEWTRAAVPAGPLCAGKCHSSALLGSRLLLFAGSMPTCAELAFLDLETLRWGVPARILGPPPDDRMSATAVLAGEEVLVFGGYTFHAREVGDLYRLRLLPSQEDEQARGSVQVPASGRTVRRWSSFWG